MADAVKWGVISTADINRKVIPGAHASPKVDLIGVASRDQAKAHAYAKEWDIPRAYGSYEELLSDPEIEAVYISLPNTMHCEWSIKSVEAGKHVLCEKPMTRHTSEVERAFDAADKAGRLLSEAFMYRHNPQTKRVKQLVDEGAIGELRVVRSVFSYSLYDEDNIRLRTELEGGALMDVGCYNISGSRLVGGEPEKVFGEAWYGPSGTDWVFSGTLRFPGDVIGVFHCGTALPEQGFDGFAATSWYGVLAPAGTSHAIVARLNAEIGRILGLADVREKIAADGGIPVGGTPERFATVIKNDHAKWGKVVRASGARLD